MEVNNVTYKLFKYLSKKSWKYIPTPNDSKFIVMIPHTNDGFPENFEIKLPISNKSKDFSSYIKNIIQFIKDNYEVSNELDEIEALNNNLSQRFKSKHEWILPESESKIKMLDKFEPYYPTKTSWK